MDDYRKQKKMDALNRAFPGMICGNPCCEELCAEVYDAAKTMRLDPIEAIRKTVERELHCRQADKVTKAVCHFGFEMRMDSLILTGEKNRKDNIIHIFRTGVDECKKCQDLDGMRISPEIWADESKMKKKGFWKQKNGEYLPHPHCRCHWEEEIIAKPEKRKNGKLKYVPGAAVTAVETVYGPAGWGEAAGAIQAGTELVTNKGIIIGKITNALRNAYTQGYLSEQEFDQFCNELEQCKADDNIKKTYRLYNRLMRLLEERGVDTSRYRIKN